MKMFNSRYQPLQIYFAVAARPKNPNPAAHNISIELSMAISAYPKRSHPAVVLFFVTALFSYTFVTVHGHGSDSGSRGCPFSSSSPSGDHHHHHTEHDHHHRHAEHDHHHHGGHSPSDAKQRRKLPEELAEEEDLKLERAHGTGHYDHGHSYSAVLGFSSPLGLWLSAMGCSLLVSLASLICLVLLPVFFLKGKPSKGVVDCLATFGAGAMLGDAFLHQLPHAFGGEHSHSHDHSAHGHEHGVGHSHAHSIKDLSIGLSVLFGIVMFLVVEKLVRYVESVSGSANVGWGHHHHHHGHGKIGKLKADDDVTNSYSVSADTNANTSDKKPSEDDDHDSLKDKSQVEGTARRSRRVQGVEEADAHPKTSDVSVSDKSPQPVVEPSASHPSSLVFGYLNLFSDGVHNFTDGMALGSAFLLYGSVGGWSRTLFLLAHELPQEIGDFGILVRSGFTVPKALFFNFLSALVALAGTALALLMGKEPGNSSLIEGFTAGGFIYIAVAGVLPELNSGTTAIKSTFAQLSSLLLGMGIALYISLVE